MAKKFEIKTRIMSQVDGSGKLTIRVNNGWSFWTIFKVQNNQAIRNYLKSDDFKEFIYTLYSKYENLTFGEMHNLRQTDKEDDKKKVEEKLNKFLWKRVEEPFKVKFSVKYKRRWDDCFSYKIVLYNNKNGKGCCLNRFFLGDFSYKITFGYTGGFKGYIRDKIQNYIDALTYELEHSKELTEKLNSYKSWDEVWVDNTIDKSLMAIVDDVTKKFETKQDVKHVA